MPSRAIPLVTISFARGHSRQTRLSDNIDRTASSPSSPNSTEEDYPPSYDAALQSNTRDESIDEVATASPSNEDLTQAVLNLSRTLVSTSRTSPPTSTSTFMYMMIYSWKQTQQTAWRFYHILSKPSSLLQAIRGQDGLAPVQSRKQRKSIQQLTDEADRLEEDLGILDGATEMVPVSMMNSRGTATMEESLPEHPGTPDIHGHSNDGDSITRKPNRRIEQYHNPFIPSVPSEDEQEDDEEWSEIEEQPEDRNTKTNSVRLTSHKLSYATGRRIPDFTSSLGPAMDPRQFRGDESSSSSVSSLFSTPPSATSGQPLSRLSKSNYTPDTRPLSPHQDPQGRLQSQEARDTKAHTMMAGQPCSSQVESPWSDISNHT
ncbi:MAG: hypothetical protein J3Q66DRAFT_346240 [Benniella sp.]|nr:MAG: hypothetical protein J3Q66DRAFT_346240 [Benniella sp.]